MIVGVAGLFLGLIIGFIIGCKVAFKGIDEEIRNGFIECNGKLYYVSKDGARG